MSETFTSRREVTLRFLTPVEDVNFLGNIHGGAVMKWIDEAAYACGAGWCGQNCVTVYVGGIRFIKPIHLGDLVEVTAKLIYTGRTSMHIAVDVRAGNPKMRQFTKTTHCVIVYVAIDENTRPVPVPPWEPKTAEDVALRDYAVRLMELRKSIEAEMEPHRKE